jgi:hypothetical protein
MYILLYYITVNLLSLPPPLLKIKGGGAVERKLIPGVKCYDKTLDWDDKFTALTSAEENSN